MSQTGSDLLDRFVEALGRGRSRARVAKALAAVLGFNDRLCRRLAHEAATRGVLICADDAGYYRPASRDEVDETVRRLRAQAFEMLSRAGALNRLADREFGKRDHAAADQSPASAAIDRISFLPFGDAGVDSGAVYMRAPEGVEVFRASVEWPSGASLEGVGDVARADV